MTQDTKTKETLAFLRFALFVGLIVFACFAWDGLGENDKSDCWSRSPRDSDFELGKNLGQKSEKDCIALVESMESDRKKEGFERISKLNKACEEAFEHDYAKEIAGRSRISGTHDEFSCTFRVCPKYEEREMTQQVFEFSECTEKYQFSLKNKPE